MWTPPIKPTTPVGAVGDNIFGILGGCLSIADQLNWPHSWIKEFFIRVQASQSYDEALAVVREHFTLTEEDE